MHSFEMGYDRTKVPSKGVMVGALCRQVTASSAEYISKSSGYIISIGEIRGLTEGKRVYQRTLVALERWYMHRKKFRRQRKKTAKSRVQKLPRRAAKELRGYIHFGPKDTLLNRILEVKSVLKID